MSDQQYFANRQDVLKTLADEQEQEVAGRPHRSIHWPASFDQLAVPPSSTPSRYGRTSDSASSDQYAG